MRSGVVRLSPCVRQRKRDGGETFVYLCRLRCTETGPVVSVRRVAFRDYESQPQAKLDPPRLSADTVITIPSGGASQSNNRPAGAINQIHP